MPGRRRAAGLSTGRTVDVAALDRLDPGLRDVIAQLAKGSAERARMRGGRAAHAVGVGARGTLWVLDAPDLPDHDFFTPGRVFPAVLRHSNAKGFDDDAVLDGRGAALRLLRGSDDPHDALLDLVLVTGQRFFLHDAGAFLRWATGDSGSKAEMLRRAPRAARALGEFIRDPDSYAALHYHSQTVYRFASSDGREWLARYRLRPEEQPEDGSFVDPADLRLPLDYVPRRHGDARATTYLRDDFRRRVAAGDLRYLLQIQLHPRPAEADAREEALDHTRAWPAEAFPWRDVAVLAFTAVLEDGLTESLRFDPGCQPRDLGLVSATGAEDPASINQARAIAYAFSAHARRGEPLPELATRAEALPLREALVEAVRGLHFTAEHGSTTNIAPTERIVTALEAGHLRHHPDALAALVAGLRALPTEPSVDAPPPEIARMVQGFADDSPRAAAGDAAAFVRVLDAYEARAIELLAWGGVLRCELFADRGELRRYLEATPSVLPADTSVPAAVRLDVDTYLVVTRFASVTPDGQRAILSEYASTVRRAAGAWAYQSVIETEYGEPPAAPGAVRAFLSRPVVGAELRQKIALARLGGQVVDVWSAALDSASAAPPERRRADGRRVCVVGAGPAGLTAARELERRGWRVTVLEQADHVGGKCASIEIGGRAYDLGGHLCGHAYTTVRALADEVGCALEPTTPSYEYDLGRGAVVPAGAGLDAAGIGAYLAERRERFPGVQSVGLHAAGSVLARPVGDWLNDPTHRALAAMALPYTASGYGYVDDPELPAMYLAKWAEMTGVFAGAAAVAERWTIVGGFERLWRRVADGLSDLRLGERVEAVERESSSVRVRTDRGVESFDELVLACPPAAALGFLDASPDEHAVLGRVRHLDYWSTVVTARGLPRLGFYLVRQRAADRSSAGYPVAFHHRHAESDVYVFYSYGRPDSDGAGIEERLREDVARVGGRVDEIHTQRRWAFLPHVGPADVADGFYGRLEALQGQKQTYWVGGLPGFELVECAVAQAADVVARLIAPADRVTGAVAVVATSGASPARSPAVANGATSVPSAAVLRSWLVERVAQRMAIPLAEVDSSIAFESYELESLEIARLIADMSTWLGWQIPPSLLFEYPTIDAVADHLSIALAASESL